MVNHEAVIGGDGDGRRISLKGKTSDILADQPIYSLVRGSAAAWKLKVKQVVVVVVVGCVVLLAEHTTYREKLVAFLLLLLGFQIDVSRGGGVAS